MKIATWNVNSVRARHDRLLTWLTDRQPDVLCIQELKVTDEAFVEEVFPADQLARAGYHVVMHGQKTYNGAAILARTAPANVVRGFDDGVDDPQARAIAADVAGVRIVNVYAPNGQQVGSEKWDYKLAWLERLDNWLTRRADPADKLIVCGDLNIAPRDADVAHPDEWADSVLCHPDARAALAKLLSWGLVDVFAARHPAGGIYSWWDYRRLAFPRNDGIRLDLLLATEPLAAKCSAVQVDRDQRKGTKDDKPSDHAPVMATFDP